MHLHHKTLLKKYYFLLLNLKIQFSSDWNTGTRVHRFRKNKVKRLFLIWFTFTIKRWRRDVKINSLEVHQSIFNKTKENIKNEMFNSFQNEEKSFSLEELKIVGENFYPEDFIDETFSRLLL